MLILEKRVIQQCCNFLNCVHKIKHRTLHLLKYRSNQGMFGFMNRFTNESDDQGCWCAIIEYELSKIHHIFLTLILINTETNSKRFCCSFILLFLHFYISIQGHTIQSTYGRAIVRSPYVHNSINWKAAFITCMRLHTAEYYKVKMKIRIMICIRLARKKGTYIV